jgi:hypothetical protein
MSRRMIAIRMPECATGTAMALATISFLLGAALAWRFNVFVLIPAIAVSLAVIAAAGIGHGEGVWAIAGAMIGSAVCLQLGYLGGAVLRGATAGTATPLHEPAEAPAAAPRSAR